MLFNVFVIIHVVTCALLIIAVLMQSSKGGGLSGAFGGAVSALRTTCPGAPSRELNKELHHDRGGSEGD